MIGLLVSPAAKFKVPSAAVKSHFGEATPLAVEHGTPASERWWAVSPSPIALDQHVASAAGLNPRRVPNIQALARHFVLPPVPVCSGALPRLSRCVSPFLYARASRVQSVIQSRFCRLNDDFMASRRNLHKIPELLRRLAKDCLKST